MSSYADFFGGQPPLWVSGTWAQNAIAISPASNHLYRKTAATGTSSTDPSADSSNWARLGAGGRKSIQEGVIAISASDGDETATVSSVVLANRTLTKLGVYAASTGVAIEDVSAVVEMTNATTITARRVAAGGAINVRYQLVETW
jgi:hypothetical protein